MTQTRLNRAVARATGEDAATIARLGFVILTRHPVERERQPLVIDWDEHYAPENIRLPRRPRRARSIS
jgi:hypothetical protein